MTPYTGKTPLKDALAELCGYSPKSHNKLTQLVNDALHGLGKTTKAKNKGVELNLAIYQWHVVQLQSVKINSQPSDNDSVNIVSQPSDNDSVNIISQLDSIPVVETFSQHDNADSVNINSQLESVETFAQYRIAFYTTTNSIKKRQVIALDGFYVNALMLAAGIDKKGVPAWVQSAVDSFTSFDCNQGITKQVKYLIVSLLVARISRDGIIKSDL